MVNIITPNSPDTFNERVAMMAASSGPSDLKLPPKPTLTPLTPNSAPPKKAKLDKSKIIIAALGLLAFVGLATLAVLISSRQRTAKGPAAPNAPESKPAANIEKPATCTLTLDIPVTCNSICVLSSDCSAINPNWDCLSDSAPSITPNPTTLAMTCGGFVGILCPDGYSCDAPPATPDAAGHCVLNDGPKATGPKHCRLIANPTSQTCTLVPSITPSVTPTGFIASPTPTPTGVLPSPTPTPTGALPSPTPTPTGVILTPTPTPTGVLPTPTPITIVTTVNCNDNCSNNTDCANVTHICFNGKCRLDANPESSRCIMPSGQTTVVVNVIPTRPAAPVKLVEAGPADWANYLKVGFGALGIGALLLLFL